MSMSETKYLVDFYSTDDRITPFRLTLTEYRLYNILEETYFKTIEEVKNKINEYKKNYNCTIVEHANYNNFYL